MSEPIRYEPVRPEQVNCLSCRACGALVALGDRDLHTAWHSDLSSRYSVARYGGPS
jgi:hypothetical protein